ncbi:unnamed protein product [Macrosiphum euphorbiae]|uniref:Uncharacterized protein n=1 Tax=Macrosiphum euphorbiae TaxID=13131 RepID=A0AAV0W9P9_9HEMI|nr:unnamed protein product [Macrosiphum euphorbiae]
MDFDGILFALDDTDFEDSGSEYNPSDVVYESDSDNRIGVEPDTENTQNLVQQENNIISDEWLNVTGDFRKYIIFTGDSGIKCNIDQESKPIDIFNLFLNDDALN